MQPLTIQPIGTVKTISPEPEGDDWSKVISELHIDDTFSAGLDGLSDWSHIVVIYSMHGSEFSPEEHLIRSPGFDLPQVGIFAQRARFHPNTLGLTAVRIMSVKDNIITVKGLDAINGSPILDIKPYAPVYDGVQDPLVPAWFIQLMQGNA
ncbi:SAM-dependent methyltransferase [Phototrophicus methaneseepsis]|uniref:SAM-dependent methyltransferase n=1 Tax=Phototrophicus methaneseepsis TaxID=2710758 RepID=A0A7S8ECY1_9CHLR|nr:SAM-dependent methyltransferase [Phototrophicus methaneseepsis]QPC84651.1 SAM-dependent methyltransferase [Phototrophicus methaneseepsis]